MGGFKYSELPSLFFPFHLPIVGGDCFPMSLQLGVFGGFSPLSCFFSHNILQSSSLLDSVSPCPSPRLFRCSSTLLRVRGGGVVLRMMMTLVRSQPFGDSGFTVPWFRLFQKGRMGLVRGRVRLSVMVTTLTHPHHDISSMVTKATGLTEHRCHRSHVMSRNANEVIQGGSSPLGSAP